MLTLVVAEAEVGRYYEKEEFMFLKTQSDSITTGVEGQYEKALILGLPGF